MGTTNIENMVYNMKRKFMKIYKFYNGEVVSLKVRETPHFYVSEETSPAFEWGYRHKKHRCATSLQEAINMAIKERRDTKYKLEATIRRLGEEIEELQYKITQYKQEL